MKKAALLTVALVVILAGVRYATGRSSGFLTPADDNSAPGRETAVVTERDIGPTVLATGVIRPQVGAEVQVGSRVSGVLLRLHATVGDRVEQGQLLAELDPTEFEARLQQNEAALETAIVERDFARQEYERAKGLIERQVIAQSEYDNAERMFNAAEAQLKQAQANLRSAKIQLEYTRIRAPISGVVAGVSTQVGETVAASFAAPTFVTIIDLDRLEVWAYVDETDIGRVAVAQKAVFTVDTYPDTDFEGVVTAVRPKAEIQDNVVNYITVIEISDNQGLILRPEMTTTVNIVLEGREDVLAIPNGAVRRENGGSFVYVLRDDQPERRAVETGYRGRRYTEVVGGLQSGEVVIVNDVAVSR